MTWRPRKEALGKNLSPDQRKDLAYKPYYLRPPDVRFRVRIRIWRVLPVECTMEERTDHELLRLYSERREEEAFAQLVRRNCNLVWAAALRVSGNRELARDVSQMVFADLARKAGRLPPGTILAGWLYQAACHTAAKQVRGELRRLKREVESMKQQDVHPSDATLSVIVEDLQPWLDSAMGELSKNDRDVIVLRYFSGRSYPEIGALMGTSEAAIQKRVSRALDRLREIFRRRGVDVSMGMVTTAFSMAGAEVVPAEMLATITSAASASIQSIPLFPKLTLLMKQKLAIGFLGTVAISSTLYWQGRRVAHLAAENAEFRKEAEALRSSTVASEGSNSAEESGLRAQEMAELLRLRGEVARHSRLSSGSGKTSAFNPDGVSKDTGLNAEPEAFTPSVGLERLILAARGGEPSMVSNLVNWRRGEGVSEEDLDRLQEPVIRNMTNTFINNGAVRILKSMTLEDGSVRARVEWLDGNGKANQSELRFVREGDQWRPVCEVERSPSGSLGVSFFLPPTPILGPVEK